MHPDGIRHQALSSLHVDLHPFIRTAWYLQYVGNNTALVSNNTPPSLQTIETHRFCAPNKCGQHNRFEKVNSGLSCDRPLRNLPWDLGVCIPCCLSLAWSGASAGASRLTTDPNIAMLSTQGTQVRTMAGASAGAIPETT